MHIHNNVQVLILVCAVLHVNCKAIFLIPYIKMLWKIAHLKGKEKRQKVLQEYIQKFHDGNNMENLENQFHFLLPNMLKQKFCIKYTRTNIFMSQKHD